MQMLELVIPSVRHDSWVALVALTRGAYLHLQTTEEEKPTNKPFDTQFTPFLTCTPDRGIDGAQNPYLALELLLV